MSHPDSITYECPKCKYQNVWRQAEIIQRGVEEIFRNNDHEIIYSVRCKNPAGCDHRMRIAVPRESRR